MGTASYDEILTANLRAARARTGLDQSVIVRRMRALGHGTWHRQTMGKIERGERRVLAAEVVSLAVALETNMLALMSPVEDDAGVRFPSGTVSAPSIALLALGHNDRTVTWDGDQPHFTHGKGEVTAQVLIRPRALHAPSPTDPAFGEGRAPLPPSPAR